MPLDTQTFGITRYWLSVALRMLPADGNIFTSARLSDARKAFLAGRNQLAAIKNWLSNAQVVELGRGCAELTDLGRLMAARDERAEEAWTWWLFHLHLCANAESVPYSTFFSVYDSDGTNWMTCDDIIERLSTCVQEQGHCIEPATVKTYFQGIEQSLRPGWPLHDLLLVEYRSVADDHGKSRLRRCTSNPPDIVVAYGTLLFHHAFFQNQNTVEARLLIERGLARCLGLKDQKFREALTRIHQHPKLSEYLQFRHAVNLDSVQFLKIGTPALKAIRAHAYQSEEVQWP